MFFLFPSLLATRTNLELRKKKKKWGRKSKEIKIVREPKDRGKMRLIEKMRVKTSEKIEHGSQIKRLIVYRICLSGRT